MHRLPQASIIVAFLLSVLNAHSQQEPLFQLLPSSQTAITFSNNVRESPDWHYFIYRYIYNGAGVAVGDINNDGLADIYFVGNQVPNKLYLNKGNMKFEDITARAGVGGGAEWCTGVTMVDINNDGWLDIYVCRSGLGHSDLRKNSLYTNNGDLTFTDRAKEYGLANTGFGTQAYFFDYDKDGDLDMYLVNHRDDFHNNNRLTGQGRYFINEEYSDRLFRNDGGKFTDVTHEAGLANAAWGLSACIVDFNEDGWPDIYVCNDFLQPDYLYINMQDGTFTERASEYLHHMTFYSMGSDYADINNDGLPDLYVLDMVPWDGKRSKQLMASMDTEGFNAMVASGHQHQYMLNTLQLNHGKGVLSEIAQVAGIDKTDWSWAGLFADLDNDGWKDLIVTNGIQRDVTDNDFKIALDKKAAAQGNRLDFNEVMEMMPSSKVPNVVYRNNGVHGLTLSDVTTAWGMNQLINSQGLAQADLDNDGDLDIIMNNFNEPATIYENRSKQPSLRVKLKGPSENVMAIGSRVIIKTDSGQQMQEMYLSRGYLSSVEPVLHFGLGTATKADVEVHWPDGRESVVKGVAPGVLNLDYAQSVERSSSAGESKLTYTDIRAELGLSWKHKENDFNDFERELLLPHKQSEHGPFISVGDADGDGLEDFYIGGSKDHSGMLFFQTPGGFHPSGQSLWFDERGYEDARSLFFDADGDGDLDLYIVSGGNEEPAGSEWYQDRLYINDGKGSFTTAVDALPEIRSSGSVVTAGDFDGDGDLDLFVGGRVVSGRYPESPRGYLLQNNGGKFTDVTEQLARDLAHIGMVTDALFTDYDSDGDLDLLIVGEWMPLTIFRNDGGRFTRVEPLGIGCTSGWWFSIAADDVDGDGDTDYVLGNIGWNNKFHPKEDHPLRVYGGDLDGNGTYDIVLAKASSNDYYPVRGRQCSSEQMPFILQKYPTYKSFSESTVDRLYEDGLDDALMLEACEMGSLVMINEGNGRFSKHYLPIEAQTAPLRGVVMLDINGDGKRDLVGAGNLFGSEVETVRYDAGIGVCLINSDAGFESLPLSQTGFYAPGDVHHLALIHVGAEKVPVILVGNNRGHIQAYRTDISKSR